MPIFICTPAFENAVCNELGLAPEHVDVLAPGVVSTPLLGETTDPVFARQVLRDARPVSAPSIGKLAAALFDGVADPLDVAPSFAFHAYTPSIASPTLASRARLVRETTIALLKEKRRRTFRRLLEAPEVATFTPGMRLVQLLLLSESEGFFSVDEIRSLPMGGCHPSPWPGGAAPVARDRLPPSRAYQKAEEAYLWMGAAPREGERVVDLGGSPGGWSYTALRRGASVTAVDRAPLEPPVAGHPLLTEVQGDAFRYTPPSSVDWLLCDVIAEPARSLELVKRWLEERLARQLVVTVKFKGSDGYGQLAILSELFAREKPSFARVKHLAHNKNEVTVMVRV